MANPDGWIRQGRHVEKLAHKQLARLKLLSAVRKWLHTVRGNRRSRIISLGPDSLMRSETTNDVARRMGRNEVDVACIREAHRLE